MLLEQKKWKMGNKWLYLSIKRLRKMKKTFDLSLRMKID